MTALEKAKKMATVLDEKKGKNVSILKVRDETVITDYFVIATATSSTHLKSLHDEVEYQLREEADIHPERVEGYGGGGWILADYGDVILHVFDAQSREFFNLEKLWAAAEKIEFEQKED